VLIDDRFDQNLGQLSEWVRRDLTRLPNVNGKLTQEIMMFWALG
jgi:hypothetical protein